ncbi:TRAP transporter permease [Eubacteriales bacterium OttesenSCG-928-A19]|nr:TRAP transporter permease [Eubacteriales bacterium OttesenSCG-928-A19]
MDDIKADLHDPNLQEDITEFMEKYDKESVTRHYRGPMQWIVAGLCVLFALVQLYAAFTANIPATQLRPLHLGFVMMLVFLIYPVRRASRRDRLPWYDLLLAILAMACCLYIVFQHITIANRISSRMTPMPVRVMDMTVGALIILMLFECCRRVVGLPIMIIAGAFILYALFGRYMPGFLAHRGFSLERLITSLVYTTEGIMGTPLGASSTFIFLFVLFGAFLERTQVGEFFIDLANSLAGHKSGGPAKVAVITSALEGTVSGSSVANTVGSGSFTIPMMKKLGYRPEFAAAVEAAASTGGQIMPPIMGAAAFLMAESVGVPYIEVVKAAIIPALLYFVGIYIIVDLEAKKCGLVGMDKSKMPRFLPLFKEKGYLILPLLVIIGFLAAGYTPIFAALVGIASATLCDLLRHILGGVRAVRQGEKQGVVKRVALDTGEDVVVSLHNGARGVLSVAVACGMAGIIVGMITLTGLGLELGTGLSKLAGGNTLLTLMLTMVASLILGMGVPTTANYLITSTIMAGTVMKVLGVEMLTAHMFVFYFGIMADITPPVALASMAGSAIAKSDPFRTGLNSVKLAIAAFLVPYLFAYNQKMLFIGAHWYDIVQISITAIVGMIGIGAAVEGYFTRHAHPIQRVLFLIGGLLLVEPNLMTDIIGIVIIGVAMLWQFLENRKFGGRLEPSMDYYKGMAFGQKAGYMAKESFVAIGRLFAK